jgi:hypothetical protein
VVGDEDGRNGCVGVNDRETLRGWAVKTKTGWYSGDQKPVRVGWYQRKYDNYYARSVPDWFDGETWFLGIGCFQRNLAHEQSMPWRGLTEKAE